MLKATDYTKKLSLEQAQPLLWEVLDALSGPAMQSLASGCHSTMLRVLSGQLA